MYIFGWLMALLFFIFCVHMPLQHACRDTVQQARAIERQVSAIRMDKQHYGDGRADESLAKQQKAVDEALPDSIGQSRLLSMLQQAALHHGIALTALTPSKPIQQDELLVQPVRISCETDYFSLLAFLREIHGQGRFLRLDEASVHSKDGRLTCELTVSAFAMPVEE